MPSQCFLFDLNVSVGSTKSLYAGGGENVRTTRLYMRVRNNISPTGEAYGLSSRQRHIVSVPDIGILSQFQT